MDTLHQQVDLSLITEFADKLLLYLIEVIEADILGRFGGWGKEGTVGCTLVKAFKPGLVDGLANRLTAEAAKLPLHTLNILNKGLIRGEWQSAVKTPSLDGFVTTAHGKAGTLWGKDGDATHRFEFVLATAYLDL